MPLLSQQENSDRGWAVEMTKKCRDIEYERKVESMRKPRIWIIAMCKGCGKSFKFQRCGRDRLYCSKKCYKRNYRQSKKYREGRARLRRKRRARKYGNGPVQDIDAIEVYERSGWVCGICGQPVDQGIGFPDLMSASPDHIIPLAAGGTHTWDNVQLAHLICNSHKGADVSQENVLQ